MDDKLKIAAELEHFFQKTLEECSNQCDDPQKLFAASLGCQCLSNFQAVCLLVQNRKEEEARMVLRCFWEAIVRLTATVKEKDFVLKVAYAEELKSKNRLNSLPSNPELKALVQALESRLKGVDVKQLLDEPKGWFKPNGDLCLEKVADDCKLSEIHKHYAMYYGWSVHVDNRRLARFLKLDAAGKILGLEPNPKPGDVSGVLFQACNYLVGAAINLFRLFQLKTKEELDKWVSMFEKPPAGWEEPESSR